MRLFQRYWLSTRPSVGLKQTYADLTQNHNRLPENQARGIVLRTLLIATTILIGLLSLLLIVSYFVDGNHYIITRIAVCFIALAYLVGTNFLSIRHRQLASLLLVVMYGLLAALGVWQWGIQAAYAILMMCLTVTLAGILLGARYALYSGAVFIGFLVTVQTLIALGIHMPDVSWQNGKPSEFGEVSGHVLILGILALVSWLFGRQIEQSLCQARQAEAIVTKQKKLLAIKLKERTDKLRAAQLQEMQQLYRFAELGQFSTALFHDLSNHLSVLMLDLEDLKRPSSTRTLDRANESIAYIDALVAEVREQLHHDEHHRLFKCVQGLEAIVKNLQPRFAKANVEIDFDRTNTTDYIQVYGDLIRFGQVITILLNNALEATVAGDGNRRARVKLLARAGTEDIIISVSDWGVGVPKSAQSKIFEPFYGTKTTGMGIGLFITRQIVETHFKGTVQLTSASKPTTFTITIPHGKQPKK